ncbi:MAG: phosphoribosylformylglycinamidine synthase subunit PurQ [Chloroflexi bacterium]|nr:phosphoribosylformylglycinamidine synthase subunit PurQ [Chloroflexota bacterium]
MRWAVLVFPGTNCDLDCVDVLTRLCGQQVQVVWHRETRLPACDRVVLPGGFSYGDYLRAGALARFSPIMRAVEDFAAQGGLVLGICNGFQILTEAGLLPGALLRNTGLRFRCAWTHLRLENANTPFTHVGRPGQVLRMPINHGEGRYFVTPEQLAELEAHGQVVLRYCAPDGSLDPAANPNGSVAAIAGVCNRAGNVFGLMPHPERCADPELGETDGRLFLDALLQAAPARALVEDATLASGGRAR